MSEEERDTDITITLKIPIIKADSEAQTSGKIISKSRSPVRIKKDTMEDDLQTQSMSIRKRRNLSKNRGLATRQREKTPEPGRVSIPHEDSTSEDEMPLQRTSREIEADNTYEEMKRLVQEQANAKDPVYDLDTDEILEARTLEANERRRRSISPFALPEKEELTKLERKGSFIDPGNKLLSTNYNLSPKDENSNRRGSLTLDSPERKDTINYLSTPPISPKDKEFPQSFPTAPKKLEEIVYLDEVNKESLGKVKRNKSIIKKDELDSEEKEIKTSNKPATAKETETPVPGQLVTKIIQVERTPSKKLTHDQKPFVEVRERVVRTPSKKTSAEAKPVITKQIPPKQITEPQRKVPPVKPARSKSSLRYVVSSYLYVFIMLLCIGCLVGLYFLFMC